LWLLAMQRSRGFGFITFADPSSVDRVLAVPAHTLDGKKIDPKHATPKNKGKPATGSRTKKVFVGGVSQDTSAEEVKAYFSQFGRVEEAVMLMDQQTKRHRGFGFVTFESEDVVDRVCEIHFHTIKNKKCECKKAQPKEAIIASTATALLAAKRSVLLSGLGGLGGLAPMSSVAVPPVANPHAAGLGAAQQLVAAQQAAQVQAAVAAQAQSAAANYGKLIASYPALASYRYSPYSVPVSAAGVNAAATGHVSAQSGHAAAATAMSALANHNNAAAAQAAAAQAAQYQGYSLANVDMSSFQGVDWSSIYGMGMYV
jgi:RNA-binding protein Musashi